MSNAPERDKGLNRILGQIAAHTGTQQPTLPMDEGTPTDAPNTPSVQSKQASREPARIPPDKRGQTALAKHLAELRGETLPPEQAISYYSPELIQCTLPHSPVKSHVWIKKNGDFTLILASGIDSEGEYIGIPYGSFPRFVLAHIITQVVKQPAAERSRRIELSTHFGTFLKKVGYTGDHRGNQPSARRLRDQLVRLFRATATFEYKEGTAIKGRQSVRDIKVAPRFDLWWDFKNPEQDSLYGSWIELSQDFYDSIIKTPVPMKTEVLKALKKSPLAIDVYMWASYRLFRMNDIGQDQLKVTFGQLQAQFGTGIADENYRKFRQELRIALGKVAKNWPQLNHELTDDGLTLYSSPLLVSRGNRHHRRRADTEDFRSPRFRRNHQKESPINRGQLERQTP